MEYTEYTKVRVAVYILYTVYWGQVTMDYIEYTKVGGYSVHTGTVLFTVYRGQVTMDYTKYTKVGGYSLHTEQRAACACAVLMVLCQGA